MTSAAASRPPPRRRGRKRLLLAAGLLVLGAQAWVLTRNAARVRVVVYNDGPGPVADAALTCFEQVSVLGELAMEESRQSWFRPPEGIAAVVVLKWADAAVPHEAGWSAEPGERLTVRVGTDGDTTMTRERSLGRRFWDTVMAP